MVLVDSSIWIAALAPHRNIEEFINPDELLICPPVVQEVLQGAANEDRFIKIRNAMLRGRMLDAPMPYSRYEEAARLFLHCRKRYTIRSSVDCLIAACAIAHGVTLLHNDADFERIAEIAPLDEIRVTPSRPA